MSEPGWTLEVVRGRDPGRTYAVATGATVLGNALAKGGGLDLSDQEGDAPRRMAARHAALACSPRGLAVRDLDSPGGTFVNRERVLPGKERALQAGDVLQLGGVQLKVGAAPTRPPVQTGPLPASFVLAGGAVCRTWDDFLTLSAQRWGAMREELTSGRLRQFLVSIRRPDLAPPPLSAGAPDEQLDAWLGTLPVTRPSRPELEVHPQRLDVRVAAGGGTTERSLQITNIGYRLLRCSVRVEPPNTAWIQVDGRPFVTIEATELKFTVHVPDALGQPLTAALVIEGNGGARRVEVSLERRAASVAEPPAAALVASDRTVALLSLIARQPIGFRLVAWGLAGALLRSLLMLGSMAGGPEEGPFPRLGRSVLILALAGGVVAARLARRHGEPRDVPAAAFAGGCAGALAASVLVAVARTLEPLLPGAPLVLLPLWVVLGLAAAGASIVLVPFVEKSR